MIGREVETYTYHDDHKKIKTLTLLMTKMVTRSPKITSLWFQLGFANHLALIVHWLVGKKNVNFNPTNPINEMMNPSARTGCRLSDDADGHLTRGYKVVG